MRPRTYLHMFSNSPSALEDLEGGAELVRLPGGSRPRSGPAGCENETAAAADARSGTMIRPRHLPRVAIIPGSPREPGIGVAAAWGRP